MKRWLLLVNLSALIFVLPLNAQERKRDCLGGDGVSRYPHDSQIQGRICKDGKWYWLPSYSPSGMLFARYGDTYVACFREMASQIASQMSPGGQTNCIGTNIDQKEQPTSHVHVECTTTFSQRGFRPIHIKTAARGRGMGRLEVFIESNNVHLYTSSFPETDYLYHPSEAVEWDKYGAVSRVIEPTVSGIHTDSFFSDHEFTNSDTGSGTAFRANELIVKRCLLYNGINPGD
jgi:hypothetical protein